MKSPVRGTRVNSILIDTLSYKSRIYLIFNALIKFISRSSTYKNAFLMLSALNRISLCVCVKRRYLQYPRSLTFPAQSWTDLVFSDNIPLRNSCSIFSTRYSRSGIFSLYVAELRIWTAVFGKVHNSWENNQRQTLVILDIKSAIKDSKVELICMEITVMLPMAVCYDVQ